MSENSGSGNDSGSDSSSSDGRKLSGKKTEALSTRKSDTNTRANATEKVMMDSGMKVGKNGNKQLSSEATPSAEGESIPRSVRGSGDSGGSSEPGNGGDSSGSSGSEQPRSNIVTVPGGILFYVVLVVPGFIAVMIVVSLVAVEDEIPQLVLLIWGLVSNIIIDGLFLAGYQLIYNPIGSYEELWTLLSDPFSWANLITLILLLSGVIGVAYAVGILIGLPDRLRRALQVRTHITHNPCQPWENFMKGSGSIRIKMSGGELYAGGMVEWSRAGEPKEVRVRHPYRHSPEEEEYKWVDGESMPFLEDDIGRILLRKGGGRESFWARVRSRPSRDSSAVGENEGKDDDQSAP